jgi:hypothetical protein
VVELSSPEEISSMKRAFAGPTSISPALIDTTPKKQEKPHVDNSMFQRVMTIYETAFQTN